MGEKQSLIMKTKIIFCLRGCVAAFGVAALAAASCQAAGLLRPVAAPERVLELTQHHVRVVINNGFARTVVEQEFANASSAELEAIYTAPVPENGALSEMTIWAGERVLQGEVVAAEEADRIYEEEKQGGNAVGKASQDAYQDFEFRVYPVPANGSVRLRYVYYEPLEIDTGVGRYLYRLEEGGTDEAVSSFWTEDNVVASQFSIEVLLKSAYPVAKTRIPGFGGSAQLDENGDLLYRYESAGALLDEDFVFYYLLEENLPGRLEMMTYRQDNQAPGTFMMVMTPGEDLARLDSGSDTVFVLDVSGSMQGKLSTLLAGVKKAIEQMRPQDRFRVVLFSEAAWEVGDGWMAATEENVAHMIARLDQTRTHGGTNVHAGVHLGFKRMDADRVSTMVLVTDGVTNRGIVDPKAFYRLMKSRDVRFHGFLLGNNSNWPLMRLMADASGGNYRAVSNADDIIGEILMAKGKITHEAMRDARLSIEGVGTSDVGDFRIGKVHYGDQLVLFGRYDEGGEAKVRLRARVNGEDRLYETSIDFPDTDRAHPELERMWALDQAQKIELNEMAGFVPASEAAEALRDIGVAYQIVTNETSMIVLSDEDFSRRGIERSNLRRIQAESAAAQANPTRSGTQRVDTQDPMYARPSGGLGGAGAIEHWFFGLAGICAALLLLRRSGSRKLKALALLVAGCGAGLSLSQPAMAGDARLSPWTDRDLGIVDSPGSIDRSIANFWGVSESEASEDRSHAGSRNLQQQSSAALSRKSYSSRECSAPEPAHELEQSRERRESGGHFGINLFNAIPVIDFVWGDESRTERDSYSGTASR